MSATIALTEPVFRTATSTDVSAIVALVESAYRGEVSQQGWTTEADLLDGQRTDPESVGALLGAERSRVVILERGATILCCCHIQAQSDVCQFGMFAVSPTQQGSGIGKLVIAQAERVAREEWNCASMEMTVIVQRASLIAWYERRGYQRTGKRKPFPYGNEKFGIPKRDDLEFEILAKSLV